MRNLIIFLLTLVLIGIAGLAVLQDRKGKSEETAKPVPTPSPDFLEMSKELGGNTAIAQSKHKIVRGESYKGENFEIEYSNASHAYYVYPQAKTVEDYRSIKKEAERIFLDGGISDLCQIRILFVIPQEIKNQFQWEDLFATGCAPS